VHGFSSPSIVEKIIDQLPEGQGKSAFLLYTAGDCVRINQMAGRRMKTLLKRRHYDVSYERLIVMGSNWLIGYTDAFNRQLYTAAQAKARHMALQIKQQEKRLYAFVPVLHHAGWLFHKMERLGAKLFGYTLYTADTCTQCGKCIQACPVGNIYHKEGGIQFRGHCQMCMRCLYQCPVHAIRSHGLQWMVLKSGYSLETILDVSLDGEDIEKKGIVTAETKGYFKHFISYFEDIDR
jgi:ferredoxin